MENDDIEDAIIERAAIIEFGIGVPRKVAEKMACAEFGVEWVDAPSDR